MTDFPVKRTVTITRHGDFLAAVEAGGTKHRDIDAACGYLAGWAFGSYDAVAVYQDHEGNMHAGYSDAGTGKSFSMMGLLTGNTYSFHS